MGDKLGCVCMTFVLELLIFLSCVVVMVGCVGNLVVKSELLSKTDVGQFYSNVTNSKFVKRSKSSNVMSIVLIPFCAIFFLGMVLMICLTFGYYCSDHSAHGMSGLGELFCGGIVGIIGFIVLVLLIVSVVLSSLYLDQQSPKHCREYSNNAGNYELSENEKSFIEGLIGSPITAESFQKWVFDRCVENYGKNWTFFAFKFQFFFPFIVSIPVFIVTIISCFSS